ncbi:ABC-2 family transporter protein [Candidatus Gottesmanbacteria bacterium]|nr:ABC-2 family transporter protein [Candidatus Gottesmanbacteria bacterium]
MKLFLQIFRNSVSEVTAYRLNFTLWRFRLLLRLLILFFLWQAIYSSQSNVFGYSESQMLTYILLSQIVATFIFSSKTQEFGELIYTGNLSNWLTKPINIFKYLIARDIADKSLNFIFSVAEVSLVFIIFSPPIFISQSVNILPWVFISIILGIIMYFMVSFLLSLVSFWTQESWAHRFLFFVISDFLAGGLFPLDILPQNLYKILLLTPFPYMMYFPLKIYIGGLSGNEIITGFTVLIFWLFIFYFAYKYLWKKGLRLYTAEGR